MEKTYVKDLSRMNCSFFDVRSWYEGESKELEKELGFGFYNTIFVVENGELILYYDLEECEKFYEALDKTLDEDFFNKLCDNFFGLIAESENAKSDEALFRIMVRCWPALVIFDELSKYPEYGTELMVKRLLRIRKSTEDFSYKLSNRVSSDEKIFGDYIFFKGEIFRETFQDFLNKKGITIK